MSELHKIGIIVGLLIVLVVSLIGFVYLQEETINQNPDQPTPTPSPMDTPGPTKTPTPTTTPNPNLQGPANLTINVKNLRFGTDGGLLLIVIGDITNNGAKTAYNVSIHVQTWFPDGRKGIDSIERLNRELFWVNPFRQVNIAGGETYTLTSRFFSGELVSVPGEFWLDGLGEVYPYDLIYSYLITPIWDYSR